MSETQQRPQRVLACVLCQQRRVKCDRKFPCSKCVAARSQCIPATLAPRRRRFPERVLLERIKLYEDLLRRNNINFDPLHSSTESASTREHARDFNSSDDACSEASKEPKEKTSANPEAVNLWNAVNRVTLEPSECAERDDHLDESNGHPMYNHNSLLKDVWGDSDRTKGGDQINAHLLFGAPEPNVDLYALQPEQFQIFKLWQIYLENIDPLLKVTHTPTLQPRLIDAIGDTKNINPTLEALLFGIYCVSVMSITDDECYNLFKSPKKDLLARYQFACRQALLTCKVWRSTDIYGLTALYLYLVSVRAQTDPWSLSSMLALTIRIAKRMGMHDESSYARYTFLEAESRRRLWWSLIMLDHRICEISDYKITTLTPTWDCRPPSNVNDFEIRAEIKALPVSNPKPTEALFIVVRSQLADFIRHSAFHLDFVNPSFNAIVQSKDARNPSVVTSNNLSALEKSIHDRYLVFCDPACPLHFLTIWMARGYFARYRLLEYYAKHTKRSTPQTEQERNAALSNALRYLWLVDNYVPALACIHILNDLKRRPAAEHAQTSWDALSSNYEVRLSQIKSRETPAFFIRAVIQAWGAREVLLRHENKPAEPPLIVSRSRGGQGTEERLFTETEHGDDTGLSANSIMDLDEDQFWATIDWGLMHTQGW
ncbi:fungal specific transcription factor, putative [Paecilomyces variotii No. 5]|uniref:Fungal specific transcription factor, putative n=1 Tax=Byssochlamys spectabilis (strain No. 5 / NBRC 109023) TaxID=1356009 RepID=V5HQJ8_BYSSN|nr:fungal specific transcription factor, putative [Paecilomyces variotii No. 5]